MNNAKLSWDIEKKGNDRAVIASEVDVIQVDCPHLTHSNNHFTIFWRGMASSDHLHNLIRENFNQGEMLAVNYFFLHQKLELPPHQPEIIPSPLDTACVRAYGAPGFLRYEIYPFYTLSSNINRSRYTLWASLTSPEQSFQQMRENEIGLFTTIEELEKSRMVDALAELIEKTMTAPLKEGTAKELIAWCCETVKESMKNKQERNGEV